jgi:hypothetical protein
MEIFVERQDLSPKRAIGQFYFDGIPEYYSLEDAVREIPGKPVEEWKIPKQTAIPVGRYRVILSRSERFSKKASAKASAEAGHPVTVDVILPELLGVPGFLGIRIHGANDADDIEGCIGAGTHRVGHDEIAVCKPAVDGIIKRIDEAISRNESVWLTVQNPPTQAA